MSEAQALASPDSGRIFEQYAAERRGCLSAALSLVCVTIILAFQVLRRRT